MYANVRKIIIFSFTAEREIYIFLAIITFFLLYIIINCLLGTQTILEVQNTFDYNRAGKRSLLLFSLFLVF